MPGEVGCFDLHQHLDREGHLRTAPRRAGRVPAGTLPAWILGPSQPLAVCSEMLSKWIRKQDTGLLPPGQTNTEKLLNPGFEALGQTLADQKRKKKISQQTAFFSPMFAWHLPSAPLVPNSPLHPPSRQGRPEGEEWASVGPQWLCWRPLEGDGGGATGGRDDGQLLKPWPSRRASWVTQFSWAWVSDRPGFNSQPALLQWGELKTSTVPKDGGLLS